jgi:hypothetical protein
MLNFRAGCDSLMRSELKPRRNNYRSREVFSQDSFGITVAPSPLIGNVAIGRAKALIVQAMERFCFWFIRRSLWLGVTKKQ